MTSPNVTGVAVGEPVVDGDRERVGVVRPGRRAGSGGRAHLAQGADVVVVLVGRHDDVEPLGALLEQGSRGGPGSAAASTSSCAPVDRQVSR